MFVSSLNMLFFVLLFLSTVWGVSSSSWLTAWVMIEFNLMSFIPLIFFFSLISSAMVFKYFFVQSLSSVILIVFILMTFFCGSLFNPSNNLLFLIPLSIKLGLPPFHIWVVQVAESLSFIKNFFFLVWQKILPLVLMSYVPLSFFILFFLFSSSLMGPLGALNQNNLKCLMVFSSISHMGWFIICFQMSEILFFKYFLGYFFIMISFMFGVSVFSISNISGISSLKFSLLTKIFFFFVLLSAGGMPPFLGFFIKVLVISSFCFQVWIFYFIIILLFSSVLSVFFYMKICYSVFFSGLGIGKMNILVLSFDSLMLYLSLFSNLILSGYLFF